jgi:hypothetical protein
MRTFTTALKSTRNILQIYENYMRFNQNQVCRSRGNAFGNSVGNAVGNAEAAKVGDVGPVVPKPKRPPEASETPLVFLFRSRYYMTLSKFCRCTTPSLSNTTTPRRQTLDDYDFADEDTLIYEGGLQHVDRKYHRGAVAVPEEHGWQLRSEMSADSKTTSATNAGTTVLHPVELMRTVAYSQEPKRRKPSGR